MKNTKLLFEMLLVGLIFVTCLFKSRERICAGELQVECVLHKIEICNICQHDFNSSLCSHSKGVLYGGNECTPYEERYCNICGENIVYCEHEEGVEYGGTECNPWERCNICGNNYYDAGGACSHWKGEYYGGEECSPYEIYVCNICGENYWGGSCSHSEGAWYDEGYCELDKLTICNICGNNYFDPDGACSHWEGEMYGQVECTTTTICNICGNNYYDIDGACLHWKGNYYGGTVCEYNYLKICNLCGNNYNDPSACGHWEGQSYGDKECSPTDKMMCNICNDWYMNCCHIVGREYKNIAYYFYIESRYDQMNSDVSDLEKIGNDENNPYNDSSKIYAVVKYETNSNEQFINAWNSLGIYDEKDCCIYTVIMNMHGNEYEISNGVGKGYSFKLDTSDIESLKKKPVQRLVLLQCSVGKISSAGENIASSFARVVSGRVLAGDAEVNNNKIEGEYMGQFPDEDNFTSINMNTYVRYYVQEGSNGWFIYKYDWNERKIKYEYMAEAVKKFRIYQLLAFFD